MAKIKWEVCPAATGPYRSFSHRMWPTGTTACNMTFLIGCLDEYEPSRVKVGNHSELKLSFRDDVINGGVKTFKKRFATLAELKEFAKKLDIDKLRQTA